MIHLLDPVIEDLQKLEPLLVEFLLTPNAATNQVIEHIFSSGGKRVRPGLFLLTCQLIGYTGPHKYPIASVCEYIHTASLLHDDVIDNSTQRRNKPTANSVWGDETAVLAGDLIYSAACRLMVRTRSLELIDTFAECIRFMSESELFQLDLLWKVDTTQEQYERVVAGKTASLFAASTLTPNFLAENSAEMCAAFNDYGKYLGYAFQIADDCLDYEGDAHLVGKDLVKDLAEGKVTLPLILGMSAPSPSALELKQLVTLLLEKSTLDSTEQSTLLALILKTEGMSKAKQIAKQYADKASAALTAALEFLPEAKRNSAAAQSLFALTRFVIDRKH
jgi:octaprenyl-diphosphate synthase